MNRLVHDAICAFVVFVLLLMFGYTLFSTQNPFERTAASLSGRLQP